MRPTPSTIAWLLVPAGTLVAFLAACAAGLYVGGAVGAISLVLCAVVSACLILRRHVVADALLGWMTRRGLSERRARVILLACVVAVCAVLSLLSLEVPYADGGALALKIPYALLELVIIALFLTTLLFLSCGGGAGIALGSAALALVGVAQFFVADFKAYVIMPSDLMVLGTAAAVAGGYVYAVGDQVLVGLSLFLLSVGVASLASVLRPAGRPRRVARSLGAAAACAVLLAALTVVPSYADDLGVSVSGWNPLGGYRTQGFIPSFVSLAQGMAIEEPEGYSDEAARELLEAYEAAYDEGPGATASRADAEAQFAEEAPSLVVIVDETFADLNELVGEGWGYAGPERYNSIDDALMRGSLTVSTTGGGTCNTEFELLTGISLGFVGEGTYPFSFYDLSGVSSLPRQLAGLGYETTAMHPNLATNYNRSVAYPALGFDEFLSDEDFEGEEWFHSGVSDEATFDRILELLEGSDAPQLIYDLTMQNHSSYDQDNLGDVPAYSFDGLDEGGCEQLSEYLACIEETDRALGEFLAALEGLDRPVVVLFLGDHQSYVAPWMTDAQWPDEEEPDHSLRLYETTYCLWANYDVAGCEQVSERVDASASNVVALALNALGAPLNSYQKAQVVTYDELPATSVMGVRDQDGAWTTLDEKDALPDAYADLERMAYLEFAQKVR